jgi:glycosyltransferase involved in cell wall biosynthesis
MTRPLLSIVVPTRERGEVLQHTLEVILSLKNPAFEFVVCDNASTDGTPEIVSRYSDPRLRYVRFETRLSMPENFERGLRLATGDYVMTLGDDDLIIEENLELALATAAAETCDLVYWNRAHFYWGSYPEKELAGSFAIPNGRGVFPVDTYAMMMVSYRGFVAYQWLPSIYNSLCKRSFLETYCGYLRGRYFTDYVVSLDIFSSLVFSSLSPSTLYLQSPASVSGISHRSNGMSIQSGGTEFGLFIKELGYGDTGYIAPEQFRGKVRPITSHGLNALSMVTDYVNVATRLLAFTHPAPPRVDILIDQTLRQLLAGGHVEIAPGADLLLPDTGVPLVQEDLITYFFRLWSIPFPQYYAGKFADEGVTVRDLHIHLTSIGYNKAAG